MDIAVLSDIHSNYRALECCISYAASRGIRTFFFLGDYVGDLAYPQKTMELLYKCNSQYRCFFIKGNKEDYWLEHLEQGETGWKEYDSTTGTLYYSYHQLQPFDLSFFHSLKFSRTLRFRDLPQVTICHGSPFKTNQKLSFGTTNTRRIMDQIQSPLIICGHTHYQGKYEHNGTVLLNPGAVGVPLNSDGKTQFLLLHGENGQWSEEFISLPYDNEGAIHDLYTSGLMERAPYWARVTEHLLRHGNVSHTAVLRRTRSLCSQDTGHCEWPDIPEKYWKQACEELLIKGGHPHGSTTA